MDITGALRDAVAWVRGESAPKAPIKVGKPADDEDKSSSNPFVWFWESIQGDFNDNRNGYQMGVDAAISMIPLVDQVCDVRDLIANCIKIRKDPSDGWAWVSLVLTVIGLFPTLGSLVKGVLKIFFAYIRRWGGTKIAEGVDAGMTMVITYLRKRDVYKHLAKLIGNEEPFKWLAKQVQRVRKEISPANLKLWFDGGIKVIEDLVNKVSFVPNLGTSAKETLAMVKEVRLMMDSMLGKALKPVDDIFAAILARLEREALIKQKGIVNASNIHYRGPLPEAAAIPLMRKRKPKWLTENPNPIHPELNPKDWRVKADRRAKQMTRKKAGRTPTPRDPRGIYPTLTDQNIKSFSTLAAATITGPARLYRILAPNSRGMSDCWVSEQVFKELNSAPDPKAAWRKYLAVWPDWNVDGQFVIYDVKKGESLNVYRGLASSQTKPGLPGFQLEGGKEQIIFNVPRSDVRNDAVLYYRIKGGKETRLGKPMTQADVNKAKEGMSDMQKKAFDDKHLMVREHINHPNISGPFNTGWGYTEFDGAGQVGRIGLPALPGQVTALK